ncbi:MAG: molybdenum cofactor guanylyltransferase [Verrucomicrobia bacterium]|nr:molybdenum cofactor guanylyltransferase [Verrucomicrobiota bacterium]
MPPFSAVLLAAGRSTRMGRDKALLEADGAPLWRRQRDVLAQAGAAEIFLSVRLEQEWAERAAGFAGRLYDALAFGGPMVGITAALERSEHPHVAVLAIDLPRLPAAWFGTLLAECTPTAGCVGRRGEFFEPLAAVYPRELKWPAWEALGRGEYALQRLLAQAVAGGLLRVREISEAEAPWFENWNTPERGSGSL